MNHQEPPGGPDGTELTVETAAAQALELRIRGQLLQAALLAIDKFGRSRSTGEIEMKIRLDQGAFPAPYHVVDGVRADLLKLILDTRGLREALLKRRTR